jgi:hypothetical protein
LVRAARRAQPAPAPKPPSDDDYVTDGGDLDSDDEGSKPDNTRKAGSSKGKGKAAKTQGTEFPAGLLPLVHPSLKPHGFVYRSNHPPALAFDQIIPVRVFAAHQAYSDDIDFANSGEVETTYIDERQNPRNPVKPDLYL